MPSFSDLPGSEGFLSSGPALVSQSLTRAANLAAHLKDQPMLNARLSVLALAGLSLVCASRAATIVEDFSTNPQARGWQVFGNTNLFAWNSTNQNLEVTWDSTQPNSYFYYPLGISLTRYDDFSLEFDLRLNDIASGVEPGKTGPLEIGFGFLNLAEATSTNFMRGSFGGAPDVAEFDYYTSGYYDYAGMVYPAPPSTVPSFIPGTDSFDYAPAFVSLFETELPTNQTVHIRLAYTGANQTAILTLTTNGVLLSQLPPLVLSDPGNSEFIPADNFHVDTFSISSYSSTGDDYDSVLAHGTVDNLAITAQILPIASLAGGLTNGLWQAQVFTHSNWFYTLERSTDLHFWTTASLTNAGMESLTLLQDTNPPSSWAFYRVRAEPPITGLTGGLTNGLWQARFFTHSNWLYTLERSTDLRSWAPASFTNAGNDNFMMLQDANPPSPKAFYRVWAQQP